MRTPVESHGARSRSSRSILVAAFVPAATIVILAAVASVVLEVPAERAFSDPLAQAGEHPLLGFVSNLGVLLWAAAAGACLLAALVLDGTPSRDGSEAARFFAAAGVITALLALDDTFQLHEDLVTRLLGRGQLVVVLGYVVLVAAFVAWFRRFLGVTRWAVLATAGAFFAVSIGADFLPRAVTLLPGELTIDPKSGSYALALRIAEDGSKFVGIALWFAYFVSAAADATTVTRTEAAHADDPNETAGA